MSADRSSSMNSVAINRRDALKVAVGIAAGAAAIPAAIPTAAAAPRARSGFARATESSLDAMANALIAERLIPGLSVAVMRESRPVYVKGFGLANVETNTPVAPQSVFRVGSVSKQFAATALALLAEDGKLSLDDRLSKFLPLFPRANEVTLRQMITHTSGMGNYTETATREAFFKAGRVDYNDAELLAAMSNTSPLYKSEPGTAWAYSNTAYVLLGLVVQIAAGESWASFFQRRLFAPAGLTQTAVDDAGEVVPHRANGYSMKPGAPGEFRNAEYISMTFPHAAGALRSTASDLCRWHAALLGGKIVKAATLDQMRTPARLKSGELPESPADPTAAKDAPKKPMKYGFGLMFGDFEGHEYTEHDGGIHGFVSMFRSFWPQQVTVAVLVNYDGFDTPEKIKRVRDFRDAVARSALA